MRGREPPREDRPGRRTERYRGPPMTFGNMRQQGVRSLWVVCDLCHGPFEVRWQYKWAFRVPHAGNLLAVWAVIP